MLPLKNVENGTKSVGGDVIFLCNDKNESAPLYWQSKTIKNVCTSVKESETKQLTMHHARQLSPKFQPLK